MCRGAGQLLRPCCRLESVHSAAVQLAGRNCRTQASAARNSARRPLCAMCQRRGSQRCGSRASSTCQESNCRTSTWCAAHQELANAFGGGGSGPLDVWEERAEGVPPSAGPCCLQGRPCCRTGHVWQRRAATHGGRAATPPPAAALPAREPPTAASALRLPDGPLQRLHHLAAEQERRGEVGGSSSRGGRGPGTGAEPPALRAFQDPRPQRALSG
jgi:hypothetical protein